MLRPHRFAGKVRNRLDRAVAYAVEQLEVRRLLSTTPSMQILQLMGPEPFAGDGSPAALSTGGPAAITAPQVAGALAGKVLYTSGGHGYVWRPGTSSWGVMRSYVNGMMEDMGNQDQLKPYADYALNAGATFVSMRPIGNQTNEVIVDNSDAYSAGTGGFDIASGSWSNSTGATYWSNNDGNDAVHYRFASTVTGTETGVARFTPNIPSAGLYPVYAWYNPGSNDANNNRSADQLFRIRYNGGSQEIKIAANKTGKGWVYLGTYYFGAGVSQTNGAVEISNLSATSGKVVIADGIRFGNGMGDWTEYGAHAASGKSREDECALYWCYRSLGWSSAGVRLSDDLVDGGSTSDDETKNFSACDRFAAYMNNENVGVDVDRVWMSFHSNAGGGRGTVGLITSDPTVNQAALANLAGVTVRDEMIALDSTHEYNWFNDPTPTYTGAYGEIDGSTINYEMDATIIEVAFHDDASDAALLKDPKVRNEVGRATYHTAIKYFDQFDAAFTNITYLPEPVRNLRVTTSAANTNLTVSWQAPQSSSGTTGPYGNAATGYRVWTSTNGYGFDLAGTTTSTSYTLTGNLAAVTYVRVTATNAGGESLPSVIAGAKPQSGRRAPILIVNNFDRLDRPGDKIESHYFGTISRARARYNNSFDYVVQAAEAVENYNSGLGIEYCTDAAVAGGQISLSNYHTVIWMSGEQSTDEETFDATTQPLVTSFLSGGGKMFVSGAEIAWDLWGQSGETAADNTFLNNTLRATYVGDDAATYTTAAGIAGTALAGVSALNFDNGTHGTYDVDYADVLGANGAGASVAMNYSTGAGNGAVIQYASGNTKLIYMGFGFESIYTASQRNSLMGAVLKYLGTGFTLATGTPDLVAAYDSGTSNSDNLTNRNNSSGKQLQFTVGSTVIGGTVQIFAGAQLIGSAPATTTTTTVNTDQLNSVADSVADITVVQTDGVTTSPNSAALNVTIDTTAPSAALGPQTPTPGATNFDFTVTYADTNGVNTANFDSSDVTVTGPGGFNQAASFISAAGNVVTYRVTAPGGSWNFGDNGTYTVSQNAAQVGDLAANTRAAGSIGTVNVAVPFAWVFSNVLHVENGSSTLTLNGANVDVTQGSTLSFANGSFSSVLIEATSGNDVIDINGSIAQPITFNGGGSGSDAINVHSGTSTLANDAGAASTSASVMIDPGATLNFAATQNLGTLDVDGNAALAAGGDKVIVAASLSVAGRLDLKDNDLVWNYSGATPIGTWSGSAYTGAIGLVASGRNGGDWTGNGIVTSMSSAVAPQFLTTIAVAEASDLPGISPFAGVTLDADAILFKYTYIGDANLDGEIDGDDYFAIDSNVPSSGSVFGQTKGDFDLNGAIDADDYFLVDTNYSRQGLPL